MKTKTIVLSSLLVFSGCIFLGVTNLQVTESNKNLSRDLDDFVRMFRSVYLKDIFSDYWWKSSGGDPRGAASFGSSQGSFRRIQAAASQLA